MNACYRRIYTIVRRIPYGRVMTYGQIARLVADVCTSQVPAIQVGRAMAASGADDPDLPWWRVIGSDGHRGIIRKHGILQRDLLAGEGIRPDDEGRYDLEKYLFTPAEDDGDKI